MSCLQWDWTTNRLSIKCAEFAMSDYGVLDYIPVIGDIYRYGKLGWILVPGWLTMVTVITIGCFQAWLIQSIKLLILMTQ